MGSVLTESPPLSVWPGVCSCHLPWLEAVHGVQGQPLIGATRQELGESFRSCTGWGAPGGWGRGAPLWSRAGWC